MSSFSFSIPIESVPLLDEHLTVAAATRQLSHTDGRPAIVLDRATYPLGLLFPHRLLDPEAHPDRLLGSLSATLLAVVPLIRSSVTREMLKDCTPIVQQPAARYAIAIAEDGRAIGVIDLLALSALESMNRTLPMIVDRFTHEMASPLMGVLSLVTLLEDERFATLPEPHRKHIQAIGHSANRMAYELERLDLASRIHQGKLILYPEATTLASLCGRAIAQIQDRCQPSRSEETKHRQADRVLRRGSIEPVAIWMDRRYGLYLFAAAIECVLGRHGNWEDLRLSSEAIEDDLVVSFQSDTPVFLNALTPQSLHETIPLDRTETLCFLRTLVGVIGGDVSLKPSPGEGFYLDLLLPSVVISDVTNTQITNTQITNTQITDTQIIEINPSNTSRSPTNSLTTSPKPPKSGVASKRAIVLTQRLSGEDLALLKQRGWYVAIALSIRELSEKIAHLSPQLVLLDCDTHEMYRHLTPQITHHLNGQAIATIRDQPTAAKPSQIGSNSPPIPDTFALRYPLQSAEVASCFQWASVINSTLILLDLRDPLDTNARSPQNNTPLADQLRRHHYRTIEVDDLNQAQLFAEIWQPHVIVLQFSDGTSLGQWPQTIEQFADRVNIPCLIVQFSGWFGQASRLDRSIVYWPELSESEERRESDIIHALQWLQYHYPILR